ncbi:MAG: TMEM43 family protein [Akkermansia sp.]|nr:TMEM43 family protein [Akkermansia sp.]
MATETITTSWFSRLGNSIKGILVGIVLFIAGIILLFWNEGRAVKQAKALEAAQEKCVEISADKIDPANEGQVVHATGVAKTTDELADPLFNIRKNGIQLERRVEYYQWVEHKEETTKKKLGGGEETVINYTYSQEWVDTPVKSEEFHPQERAKHQNTVCYQVSDFEKQASQVSFGAFMLSEKQIGRVENDVTLDPAAEITVPADLTGRVSTAENYLYISTEGTDAADAQNTTATTANEYVMLLPEQEGMAESICKELTIEGQPYLKLSDGTLARLDTRGEQLSICIGANTYRVHRCAIVYIDGARYIKMPDGNMKAAPEEIATPQGTAENAAKAITGSANPAKPKIGDVRICWSYTPSPQNISIVAVQSKNTFTPFVDTRSGYTVDMLSMGHKDAANMFATAHETNKIFTWILRAVGWFCMFIGVSMVLKPLSVVADVVPFIGNIIEFGTTMIALVVSTVVALVVIAIAWLFYRPLIAIPLLVAAVALIVWLKKRKKKETTQPAEA